MTPDLVSSPLFLAAVVFATVGSALVLAGIVALFKARPLGFTLKTLTGLLLVSTGGLSGTLAVGIQGYQALTHEEIAAHLYVLPKGPQSFTTKVIFPDGREAIFDIAGDEIYVDAHILKWKPFLNMLGLHTSYELDRLAGRYHDIDEERSGTRTIYAISQDKPIDLFRLRRRYAFLATFLDAEYGSATFVPVTRPAEFELRVSTTGLLIREASPTPQ